MSDQEMQAQEQAQAEDVQALPPPYDEHPERYSVTKNGAIRDKRTGHFVDSTRVRTKISDRSQAVALAERRWQKARAAAAAGLRELSPSTPSAFRAWREIVKAQGRLAMDKSQGKASTIAARFVGEAAGLLPTRWQREQARGVRAGAANTLTLTDESVAKLLEIMQRARG
jgi:hypothetical protein